MLQLSLDQDIPETADTLFPPVLRRAHVQWDPDLKQDLNKAVNAKIGDYPCKLVAALLLSWEDKVTDLPEVKDEIRELKDTAVAIFSFKLSKSTKPFCLG